MIMGLHPGHHFPNKKTSLHDLTKTHRRKLLGRPVQAYWASFVPQISIGNQVLTEKSCHKSQICSKCATRFKPISCNLARVTLKADGFFMIFVVQKTAMEMAQL